MKLCSLHSASFLRKHKVLLWSSPSFLAGAIGSQTPTMSMDEVLEVEIENMLMATKTKCNKNHFSYCVMDCKGRTFSLMRDSVVEASLVTAEAKTGTTIHDEKLGNSLHFYLENYRNVLWSYNAITFTPTSPRTTLTSCPQQHQSLG